MTISSCPSCHEPVRVPQGASGSARVRCPLCGDEFPLSVVVDKLPPLLVLLDVPAPATTAASDSGVSLVSEAATKPAGAPAFEFEESPAPGAKRTITPSARPKRREKSVVVEMVKIVGGGVVGLGLAILILWHVAGRDPFNLGPRVAAYVPWIVPQGMRGKAEPKPDDKTDPGSSSSNNQNGGQGKPIARNNNGEKKNDKGSAANPAGGVATNPNTKKPDPLIDDLTPGREPEKPDDDEGLKIGSPVIGTKPKETKPKETEPEKPSPPEPDKPQRTVFAQDLPLATVSDLERIMKGIELADHDIEIALSPAVKDLSNAKKIEFGEAYFAAFTRLGDTLTRIDQADPEIQSSLSSVDETLQALAQNPAKLKILATLTERSLKAAKLANRGLCLAGKVTHIEPRGKFFEIDVELFSTSKTPMQVLLTEDAGRHCVVGDRVLALGAVVANPKKNLPEYEGEAADAYCVHRLFDIPPEPEKPEPSEKPARPAEQPKPGDAPAEKPADKPESVDKPEEKSVDKPAKKPEGGKAPAGPAKPPANSDKSADPADEEAK